MESHAAPSVHGDWHLKLPNKTFPSAAQHSGMARSVDGLTVLHTFIYTTNWSVNRSSASCASAGVIAVKSFN